MFTRWLILLASASVAGPVVAQGASERVRWRFEMDSGASGAEVSVGTDSTIYASDNTKLYALRPDGTLKWSRTGLGDGKPVDFLPDGTLITGLGTTIHALDPADGSDVWTFGFDGNGFREQIEVGPNVGPDGNIYAVSTTDGSFGLGAYSLAPDGELRWSDEGSPRLDSINAPTGGPIRFTADRLIFPFNVVQESVPAIYGYDFGGRPTLYVDFTCTGVPRTDPMNRLLLTSTCGIEAMEQDGDEIYWRVRLGSINLPPAIGADATAYGGSFLGSISAISPDGTIAWTADSVIDPVRVLAVRQDVQRLVYVGAGFGSPQTVAAVETLGGEQLWSVPLASTNGHSEVVETATAPTSADGSMVYFVTRFTSNGAPGALYALTIIDGCAADFSGDGTVNTQDVLAFLNAWAAGDGRADFNGDGAINTLDVLAFLSAWSAGC